MTRRFWALAALFGGSAAGQVTPRRSISTKGTVCWSYSGTRCKPQNGECPQCGTMAKPYHPMLVCGMGELDEQCYRKWLKESKAGGTPPSECFSKTKINPECEKRLVDCEHCRAAFWQDAWKQTVVR